jgi:hypothetical protein
LGAGAALCRFTISPNRRLARLACVGGLIVLDLAFAVVSAAYYGLFMDAMYHVLSVLACYWLAERLEGRFFSMPHLFERATT